MSAPMNAKRWAEWTNAFDSVVVAVTNATGMKEPYTPTTTNMRSLALRLARPARPNAKRVPNIWTFAADAPRSAAVALKRAEGPSSPWTESREVVRIRDGLSSRERPKVQPRGNSMNPAAYNEQNSSVGRKNGVRAWMVVTGVLVLIIIAIIGIFNGLVSSDQQVQSQWGQVQNVYQRRLDLVPNLVATVKGAAGFEKSTYLAVTEARTKAEGALQGAGANPGNDQAKLTQVQQTQGELSTALSRLMVVVENYPDLKATANFRDLQSQLEGTENRITVERMRFNETAQAFNGKRLSFPTNLVAGLFGARFAAKAYFQADAGAQSAPKVNFGN